MNKKANTHSQYLQTTKNKMFKHELYGQFYIPKYYLETFNGICQYAQTASYTLGHDFVKKYSEFTVNHKLSLCCIDISEIQSSQFLCEINKACAM